MCSYFLLLEAFQGSKADDIGSGVYGNFTAETARDSVWPGQTLVRRTVGMIAEVNCFTEYLLFLIPHAVCSDFLKLLIKREYGARS